MPEWLSWLADWWRWCFDVFGDTLVGHVLGIALFVLMVGAAASFALKLAIGAVIMAGEAFRRLRSTLFPY